MQPLCEGVVVAEVEQPLVLYKRPARVTFVVLNNLHGIPDDPTQELEPLHKLLEATWPVNPVPKDAKALAVPPDVEKDAVML